MQLCPGVEGRPAPPPPPSLPGGRAQGKHAALSWAGWEGLWVQKSSSSSSQQLASSPLPSASLASPSLTLSKAGQGSLVTPRGLHHFANMSLHGLQGLCCSSHPGTSAGPTSPPVKLRTQGWQPVRRKQEVTPPPALGLLESLPAQEPLSEL